MNILNTIVIGGVLSFFGLIGDTRARVIPDFYTDEDLEAWHQFGLRSFYGPWTVIARKPNGDFVRYADYGARVPQDFQPLSSETIDNDDDDDDSSPEISHADHPDKRSNGLYDFPSGYEITPYGISVLNTELLNSDATTTETFNDDNTMTLNPNTDIRKLIKNIDEKSKDTKRDTLELIGIVGVINDDDDSIEITTTTTEDNVLTTITEDTTS